MNINILKKTSRGFTLIELLVVISIIAFMSSIVLSSLNNARARARDTQRISDMHQLQNALELYKNANGYYPPCIAPYVSGNNICGGAGDSNLNTAYNNFSGALSPLVPAFIPSIPKDPSNKNNLAYEYMVKTTQSANWFTCDSIRANTYEYVITFRTEKTVLNLPKFGTNGTPEHRSGTNEYCIIMK